MCQNTWGRMRWLSGNAYRNSPFRSRKPITSEKYRVAIADYGTRQSMNSAGGRCHDNARCESLWAWMKKELFYLRGCKSEDHTIEELKTLIWHYFMSCWNNRRICSAIGGMPPAEKRRRYYSALNIAAWAALPQYPLRLHSVDIWAEVTKISKILCANCVRWYWQNRNA